MKLYASKSQYIYIKLFITSLCNFSCPYCCFDNQRGNCKDTYDHKYKLNILKNFFTGLDKLPYQFIVRIIGGEPLLYKHLNELILFLNSLNHLQYIELYSNCSLKIPESITYNKNNKIITSIHKIKDNKFENVLNNIKNINFLKNTQFNILINDGNDIKNNKKQFNYYLNSIYKNGASAFPQLIQIKTENYLKNQRDTIEYIFDYFHQYGYSFYENYLKENFNLDYLTFFKMFCRAYDKKDKIFHLPSNISIEENLFCHESDTNQYYGYIDKEEIINKIKFNTKYIDIDSIFINEFIFTRMFKL